MRIAVFCDEVTPMIRTQEKSLLECGHQVTIFSPERKKLRMPETIEQFIETEFPNFGLNFDLVHDFSTGIWGIAGARVARKFGMGLIQTVVESEDLLVRPRGLQLMKTLRGSWRNYLHSQYLPHPVKVNRDKLKVWTTTVNQVNFADAAVVTKLDFARKLQMNGVTTPIAVIAGGKKLPEAQLEKLLKLYDSWC